MNKGEIAIKYLEYGREFLALLDRDRNCKVFAIDIVQKLVFQDEQGNIVSETDGSLVGKIIEVQFSTSRELLRVFLINHSQDALGEENAYNRDLKSTLAVFRKFISRNQARSVWADRESYLSLIEGIFTRIRPRVQPFLSLDFS